MSVATLTRVIGVEGSIALFAADEPDGREVIIGVDARMAADLIAALDRGDEPEVTFDEWQVIRRARPDRSVSYRVTDWVGHVCGGPFETIEEAEQKRGDLDRSHDEARCHYHKIQLGVRVEVWTNVDSEEQP